MRTQLLFALALTSCLTGCFLFNKTRGSSVADDGVTVNPPEQADMRLAVESLGADIARLYRGRWPKRFPVSRDFPDQPLVVLLRVEDRGETGADTDTLDRALEEAIRFQGYLRIYVDEAAVPPSLREDYPPPTANTPVPDESEVDIDVGLHLTAWVDRVGRIRLELRDAVRDETLLRSVAP